MNERAGTSHRRSESESIRMLLSGRDRRSLANSANAQEIIRRESHRVSEIVALTQDDDWLISMRALDLLEKLAHDHSDWIAPYKEVFIGELAESDKWEIRLQIVRALPLFNWTPTERRRVTEILLRDVNHPKTFVKA